MAESFGYARVSTAEQNLNRQIDKLVEHGIHKAKIYKEKMTGTKKDRPMLNKVFEDLQTGDILVVTELSRLSRSLKDLLEIADKLEKKGIQLKSLKENIDTTTPTGRAMFNMLGVISQFERDIIAERTKEGLKSARARGRVGGRPKTNQENIDRALMLYDMGNLKVKEICIMCNISAKTLYNYLEKRKENNKKGEPQNE